MSKNRLRKLNNKMFTKAYSYHKIKEMLPDLIEEKFYIYFDNKIYEHEEYVNSSVCYIWGQFIKDVVDDSVLGEIIFEDNIKYKKHLVKKQYPFLLDIDNKLKNLDKKIVLNIVDLDVMVEYLLKLLGKEIIIYDFVNKDHSTLGAFFHNIHNNKAESFILNPAENLFNSYNDQLLPYPDMAQVYIENKPAFAILNSDACIYYFTMEEN
jgi:hypothetical protein